MSVRQVLVLCLVLLFVVSQAYQIARYRVNSHRLFAEASSDGRAITCETVGSCRVIRGAAKAELNEYREAKRREGVNVEEGTNYLEMLSGGGKNDPTQSAKKFSPFKKQTPITPTAK